MSFNLPNPGLPSWDPRYSKTKANVGSLVQLVGVQAPHPSVPSVFLDKRYSGLALVLANQPILIMSDGHTEEFNLVQLWLLTTQEKIRVYYVEGETFNYEDDCYTGITTVP